MITPRDGGPRRSTSVTLLPHPLSCEAVVVGRMYMNKADNIVYAERQGVLQILHRIKNWYRPTCFF